MEREKDANYSPDETNKRKISITEETDTKKTKTKSNKTENSEDPLKNLKWFYFIFLVINQTWYLN